MASTASCRQRPAPSWRTRAPAPLLRLVAESTGAKGDADQGKPGDFIWLGALAAALCTDAPVPWDRAAARDVRVQQLDAARAALPADRFGPFSVAGWTGAATEPWYGFFELVGSYTQSRPGPCIDWPAPDRVDPVIPVGAVPPAVPTLFLSSTTSVHTPSEDVTAMAARFPGATTIEISGMDHMPVLVEPCVQGMVRRSRARPRAGRPAVRSRSRRPLVRAGRLAERVRDAEPARRASGNQSTIAERRAATLMVQTITDAFFHARGPGSRFLGLRGGTFEVVYDDERPIGTYTFRGDRLASDLRVDGTATIDFEAGQRVTGTLRASGASARRTTLELDV